MRYLRLYGHFVANSFMHDMIYRKGFWLAVIARLTWFLFFIFFYSMLYGHITSIGSWSYWDTMLLVSVFFFIETLLYFLFIKNFSQLPHIIADGDLDMWLIKPVDAQFVFSIRQTSFASFLNLLPPLFLLGLAMIKKGIAFNLSNILLLAVALIISIIIAYSLWLMFMTLAFWIHRVNVLHELFLAVFRFLQFPLVIYSGVVLILLTFIIPVLFIVSIPLEALQGSLTLNNFLIGLALAVGLFILSRLFWLFGIRYYSSASS